MSVHDKLREDIQNNTQFQSKHHGKSINGFYLHLNDNGFCLHLYLWVFLSDKFIEIQCNIQEQNEFEWTTQYLSVDALQKFRIKIIKKYVMNPAAILMNGIMYKRKWLRWKSRYFVLFADGLLYRYETADMNFKGVLDVRLSMGIKAISFGDKHPFRIELKMPDETWLFACNELKQQMQWIRYFQAVRNGLFFII